TRGIDGLIASTCFSSLTSSTTLTLRYCTRAPGEPTRLTRRSGTSTKDGGLAGAASACTSSPPPWRKKKNQVPTPPPRTTSTPTAAMISLSLPLGAAAASVASPAPSACSLSAIAPLGPVLGNELVAARLATTRYKCPSAHALS